VAERSALRIAEAVLTAADTGAPIAGASIVAVQQIASRTQKAPMYSGPTDAGGNFAVQVSAGSYILCAHAPNLYLDPCQWGSPTAVAVAAGATLSSPFKLTKGGNFIVRIHDPQQLLRQQESTYRQTVSVSITGGSAKPFFLPVTYDDGNIRDYGATVPLNLPMNATVFDGGHVTIVDRYGAALASGGVPFQALPTVVPAVKEFFPPPDAIFIHVQATGLR
jgi:hypothetical protein